MAREEMGSDVEKQDERDSPSPGYETVCWGCGLRLQLATIVPTYKCGWCGAISSEDTHAKKEECCLNYIFILDRFLVATITSFILVLIGGGMWAIFPVLLGRLSFGFFFHLGLTGILSFNTLFNYCLASFLRAGPLPELPWGSVDCVSQGGLEGHRFCSLCQKPKPPRAHHCRSCKACVLDMDHHCPFIGNCVGAANHRAFILFLFFAVISNMYVLIMSVLAIVKIWNTLDYLPEVLEAASSRHLMIRIASYVQGLLGNSLSSSVRAIALLYLVAVSLSVTIGVGLLLNQQIRQLYDGCTFIESLKQDNSYIKGTSLPVKGWRNLQRVFGHEHPLYWILPKLVVKNDKVHDK